LQSYAEHEEIYKALSDHDTDKAAKTVMTHVRNARERMNSLED
jgi:DNA-binding FadR family transcriptional regulator